MFDVLGLIKHLAVSLDLQLICLASDASDAFGAAFSDTFGATFWRRLHDLGR